MVSDHPERSVVFRGTDPAHLDLVENMLAAEGLEPLRLGRTHPALMGGGDSAFEQLITVPMRHRETARLLLGTGHAFDEDELARQALAAGDAERAAEGGEATQRGRARPSWGSGLSPVALYAGLAGLLLVGAAVWLLATLATR